MSLAGAHLATAFVAVVLLVAAATPARAQPDAAVRLEPLPSLAGSAVTVSGISSGGFFAHQFHVAFSGLVDGAGLVAAGPYACAEDIPFVLFTHASPRAATAVAVCTRIGRDAFGWWAFWLPRAPDADASVAAVAEAHADGTIDDPAGLSGDRAWIFSGGEDEVVPPATAAALADVYRRLGVGGDRLSVVQDPRAAHGFPIEEFEGDSAFPKRDCGEHAPPFLIDCDLAAAGRLLAHLLPAGWVGAPRPADPARLSRFDQTGFFDTGEETIGLAASGFLYVPAACAGDGAAAGGCRLHVAFHGCRQNEAAVGDDFVWDAGYNQWAEANDIVVLYPQAAAWTPAWNPTGLDGNPNACWDWWGYSGPDYATREGPQMRAVRAMIERLRAPAH